MGKPFNFEEYEKRMRDEMLLDALGVGKEAPGLSMDSVMERLAQSQMRLEDAPVRREPAPAARDKTAAAKPPMPAFISKEIPERKMSGIKKYDLDFDYDVDAFMNDLEVSPNLDSSFNANLEKFRQGANNEDVDSANTYEAILDALMKDDPIGLRKIGQRKVRPLDSINEFLKAVDPNFLIEQIIDSDGDKGWF